MLKVRVMNDDRKRPGDTKPNLVKQDELSLRNKPTLTMPNAFVHNHVFFFKG